MIDRLALAAIAALATIAIPAAHAATTTTTVNVTLKDSTTAPTIQGMQISADHATVKAGKVRFHVVNDSKSIKHELIVVKLKSADDAMPMLATSDRVDEKKITHLGEVGNLRPGKSGDVQLTLKPGAYLLICNETGHFHQGMKTAFTVTP